VPAQMRADHNRFSISATTWWRLSATLHLKIHLDQILVSGISSGHGSARADDECSSDGALPSRWLETKAVRRPFVRICGFG
jgi:hypothetical protein